MERLDQPRAAARYGKSSLTKFLMAPTDLVSEQNESTANVDSAGLPAGHSFVLLPQSRESVAVLMLRKRRLHAPYPVALQGPCSVPLHAPYPVVLSTASASDPALDQPAYLRLAIH